MKDDKNREKIITKLAEQFYDYVFVLDTELVAKGQEPASNHEIDIAWGTLKYWLFKCEEEKDTGYVVREKKRKWGDEVEEKEPEE